MFGECMRPELAFILGALEDGCLSVRPERDDYTIEFEQTNKMWLEFLAQQFMFCFGKTPKITKTKKGVFRLRLYSKSILTKLQQARETMLSDISTAPDEAKASFLRAMFDAEGSVHKNRFAITITNKKEDLLLTCRELLKEFGISSGQLWTDKRNNVKSLSIFGKNNLSEFREVIGFKHPAKAEKLNNLLDSSW